MFNEFIKVYGCDKEKIKNLKEYFRVVSKYDLKFKIYIYSIEIIIG